MTLKKTSAAFCFICGSHWSLNLWTSTSSATLSHVLKLQEDNQTKDISNDTQHFWRCRRRQGRSSWKRRSILPYSSQLPEDNRLQENYWGATFQKIQLLNRNVKLQQNKKRFIPWVVVISEDRTLSTYHTMDLPPVRGKVICWSSALVWPWNEMVPVRTFSIKLQYSLVGSVLAETKV